MTALRVCFLAGLSALALAGCRKDPEIIAPVLVDTINLNDVYGTRLGEVSLGADYRYQAYYSLADNKLVAVNDKYAWDVALTNEAEPRVVLNHSIPGLRVAVGPEDWTEWVDEFALDWLYDLPGGDAGAIGSDWAGVTLVLNRGLDPAGAERGFLKFRFDVEGDSTTLAVAELSGEAERTFTALRDTSYFMTQWSLEHGPVVLAPPTDEWDLVFTNYLHVYDPETDPFPYQVTGALLNPAGHRGARFDSTDFADFTAPAELESALSPVWDAIGFDWKRFDFDLGYVVTEDLTFVVATAGGANYALTFTGFTDEAGERGTPTFAYRRL